jgi:hypothetical protein
MKHKIIIFYLLLINIKNFSSAKNCTEQGDELYMPISLLGDMTKHANAEGDIE